MREALRGGRGKKLVGLAPLLAGHRDELEADFQQWYGLDLAHMLDAGEFRRARALAEQLPRASRTVRALQPKAAWGDAEYLLAYIADNLAYMRYEQGHSKKRRKKPKPYPRPTEKGRPRADERTVHGMSAERVGEILSRKRG